MSVKEIFKTFIGSIMKDMKKTSASGNKSFEWKKLGFVGAEGVARHLQKKNGLKVKPAVEEKEEAGKPTCISLSSERYTHEFRVEIEQSRFSYTRMNGKAEVMGKNFYALESQFLRKYNRLASNRRKRAKAREIRARDNAVYEEYLEIQRRKKEEQRKLAADGEDAPADGGEGRVEEAPAEGGEGRVGEAPAEGGEGGVGKAPADGGEGGVGKAPAEGGEGCVGEAPADGGEGGAHGEEEDGVVGK